MALDLNLTLNQTQKLTMTPELKQALNILQLNVIDLSQYLDEQLELNPVLETSEPEVSNIVEWNNYINRNKSEDSEYNDDNEDYSLESYVPTRTSLREHLLFQLHVMPINMSIRKVCKYIIDSMNANGYLTASLGELAKNTNESIHTVEKALEIVQGFDPPGVGARDLKECLLLQLAAKDILDEDFKNLVKLYLSDVAENKLTQIARKMDIDVMNVQHMIDILKTLNPRPGCNFSDYNDMRYVVPDAFVRRYGDNFEIIINDGDIPRLGISKFYSQLLHSPGRSTEEFKYLDKKFHSAFWLIKNIEQRKSTLYNVVKAIVEYQINFFDIGVDGLKPLTLKQIAEVCKIHESTVSRATNGKYIDTPKGIYELKFFFTNGVANDDGVVSSKSIKNMISGFIANENTHAPLSDLKITEMLKRYGVCISRRTVAKYRDEQGIPSSNRRKRFD